MYPKRNLILCADNRHERQEEAVEQKWETQLFSPSSGHHEYVPSHSAKGGGKRINHTAVYFFKTKFSKTDLIADVTVVTCDLKSDRSS